ncbi:MAG: DUF1566 domain-containing protein [Thermoanaerobaculia bacterium]|nr:DUF1566 domain-containing protein [Thermoanaerobaculia bacterium]
MWEKKGDNGDRHDKDNSYYWTGNGAQETVWDWLEDVNGGGLGGFSDWRLPNARELLSIADFQNQWAVPAAFNSGCTPGVNAVSGSCAFIGSYWTSTTQVSSGFAAWYADLYGGLGHYFKPTNFRVRAVRGGTP